MADYSKRYSFFGDLFPKQFRTPLAMFIWTLILLADVAIVFAVAYLLGIDIVATALRNSGYKIYLLIAFALFGLEVFVFNKIHQ